MQDLHGRSITIDDVHGACVLNSYKEHAGEDNGCRGNRGDRVPSNAAYRIQVDNEEEDEDEDTGDQQASDVSACSSEDGLLAHLRLGRERSRMYREQQQQQQQQQQQRQQKHGKHAPSDGGDAITSVTMEAPPTDKLLSQPLGFVTTIAPDGTIRHDKVRGVQCGGPMWGYNVWVQCTGVQYGVQ